MMNLRKWSPFGSEATFASQAVLVLASWIFLTSLNSNADGLWFQVDAPRHAANGLFWKDFLLSGSLDPKGYTLSYYARYPVIHPTAYPPFFYLLEGLVFAVLGPSPYVAKGLVLAFSLVLALYTTAWLRRWVAKEAGWAGMLVPLLPGVVAWSHSVMLNVPATAIGLAALYHTRRWLESPRGESDSKQLCLGAALSVLAIFTYYTTGVVVLIGAVWLVLSRRWDLLIRWRTALVAGLCALVIAPLLLVVIRGAPQQAAWITPSATRSVALSTWLYYPAHLHEIFGIPLLCLAVVGILVGLVERRWRRETQLWLSATLVVYLCFSYIYAREARYVMILIAPVVCFCAIAVLSLADAMSVVLRSRSVGLRNAFVFASLAVMVGIQATIASTITVPPFQGFREAAAFLQEAAATEPVLYDGYFFGTFTFYVRASDPKFERQVVRGDKLFKAAAQPADGKGSTPADSAERVTETLKTRGGCRWLAIEVGKSADEAAITPYLRRAVEHAPFELARSFPVTGHETIERIDVYRLTGEVAPMEFVDLPIRTLGEGTQFQVKPILVAPPAAGSRGSSRQTRATGAAAPSKRHEG